VAYFGSYDNNFYAVGQVATSSGVSGLVYYAVAIVIIITVVAVALVVLLKRRH